MNNGRLLVNKIARKLAEVDRRRFLYDLPAYSSQGSGTPSYLRSEDDSTKRRLLHEARQRMDAVYKKGYCLHPKASRQACSLEIVSAHTVRRNGDLRVIAKNGHVYNIIRYSRIFEDHAARSVGINKASTFRGFCSRHDNDLFAPIEKEPFRATTEQIALLGYRATCYEIFAKKGSLQVPRVIRSLKGGRSYPRDLSFDFTLSTSRGIAELAFHKSRYESMIFRKDFSNLGYYVVSLANAPEIVGSGCTQATHDFCGRKVADLNRLDVPFGGIALSLIATDDGGAAVFSWLADQNKCHNVMTTFGRLSAADQPHAIVRYMFEFFENIYFSPDWWDNLDDQVQARLLERQLTDIGPSQSGEYRPRANDCLQDDGVRAVAWTAQSRLTSLSLS